MHIAKISIIKIEYSHNDEILHNGARAHTDTIINNQPQIAQIANHKTSYSQKLVYHETDWKQQQM